MGFYDDEEKITFDNADVIVDRYLRQYHSRRTFVRTRDICGEMDVKNSMHNKIRIHEALSKQCKEIKKADGSKFKIPKDYESG